MSFTEKLFAYCRDRRGTTAIEYSLIGAGIAMAILLAVFGFGDQLATMFLALENALADAES